GEFVDARIAVAVGHEHLARWREGDIGRQVERPAAMRDLAPSLRAEIVLRHAGIGALAFLADRLQQLSVGGELVELLMVLVAEPDDIAAVLLNDADRVRKAEQPLAPGADKFA